MHFRLIETPGLAHYAYVVGDQGVAAVVDPRRDVEVYLEAARALGLRIDYVIETHRQEDFVMGSSELARRAGARIVNGGHPLFGHGDVSLQDGESFVLGGLRIRALHTPGHTPESTSYAIHLDAERGRAWGVLTGDTLMFGETGRTDLVDAERVEDHAGQLYDAIHGKLAALADETLVFPAHGPGSVCGTGLAERPMSTIGLEKRTNPVFALDRAGFAAHRKAEQQPRPPYFRHMEVVNLDGGLAPVHGDGEVRLLEVEAIAKRDEAAVLIDTRAPEAFAGGHIPGAYSIWLAGLSSFAGWIASHESEVFLCTASDDDVDAAVRQLARLGIDRIGGALRGGFSSWRESGRRIATIGVMLPRTLVHRIDELPVVDVRERYELTEGHIPGARHVFVGELEDAIPRLRLDRRRPLVVTCSVGHRGSFGASILARAGFGEVHNLLGGMQAWQALGLPLTT